MRAIHPKSKIKKNEHLLSKLFVKYIGYWPLLLLLTAICVTVAWSYLHYAIPKYESSASIMIKDEKKGADDTKALEALNILSTKKLLENEMEVIHSRRLVNEVVNDLNLYAPVYQQSSLRALSAYTSSP